MIKILKIKNKKEELEEKQRFQSRKIEHFCQYKTIKNFIVAITAVISIHLILGYVFIDFYNQINISLHQLGSVVISDGAVITSTDFDFRYFNGENISIFPDLIDVNTFKNNLFLLLVSIQTLIFGLLGFSNYKATKDTDSIAGTGIMLYSLVLSVISIVFIIIAYFNRDIISNGLPFVYLFPLIFGLIFCFFSGVYSIPKTSSSYKKMIKTLKKEDLLKENKILEKKRNYFSELNNKLYQDRNAIFEGIEATKNGELNEEEMKYVKRFIFEAHKDIKQNNIEEQKRIEERKRKIEQKYTKEMTTLANEMFNTNKSFEDFEIENI